MNKYLIIAILTFYSLVVKAQEVKSPIISNPTLHKEVIENGDKKYILPIDKLSIKGSYPLGISEQKVVHIVFPAQIKEANTGTADVSLQITESFNNVLMVKANTNKTFPETNLTVLTADGGLYSFITHYQNDPEVLNINIGNNLNSDIVTSGQLGINYFLKTNYLIPSLNISQEQLQVNLLEALNKKDFIKNVGVQVMDIAAMVKGIYLKDNIMYYKIELNNKSEIEYNIDFIKVYVKDKEKVKRMAVQEEEVKILSVYPTDKKLLSKTDYTFSFATATATISDEKQIEIEIYELNGGRHLRFPVDSKIISKSKNL
jgi:conjugative transposon TraN protein